MAWYTSPDNLINRPLLPDAWREGILEGTEAVSDAIASRLLAVQASHRRPAFLALDGYKGALLSALLDEIKRTLEVRGAEVELFNVNGVFKEKSEIDEIVRPYERPDDPSFGRVYPGILDDFIDPRKANAVASQWERLRGAGDRNVIVICHGVGACLDRWRRWFDQVAYVDVTREQILVRSERNQVAPLGEDSPGGFPWKRIYYVEYPALNRHKRSVLKTMDWYIDGAVESHPVSIRSDVYHGLIAELAGRPVAFKVFYMPGTFGGSEFGRRFNVAGLPNTSWDYELSVGDNHMLVDAGATRPLEMPFYNVLWEEQLKLVGPYSATTYPDHFPIAVYMQDGYFAPGGGEDFRRTHMPHHLHPDSAYCREHFNEPIGRYETYYIVRADPGACTMHGFKDDADIDEYVREVRRSAETRQEFDWRKYVHEHPSQTGELHQLPPGTVHGTGGRQIILEIDTNPSRESTEYSFFLYDYCRPNFNYVKNDFTGRPAKLQVEHSLAQMRRNRRQKFMAELCRPAPRCVRQGDTWREVSFPMYYNMPYQVNRFEFLTKIEDDTRDMFHCLALTRGERIRVYAKGSPSNEIVLEDCDNIVLPACFGAYVCENLAAGPCEMIKTFLIAEPRHHIDKTREEMDWGVDPDRPA